MIESNITALFLAQDNNGLCHGHPQAQPGQVGGEGDGQNHGVPDFFCQSVQKDKSKVPLPKTVFQCKNCKTSFSLTRPPAH